MPRLVVHETSTHKVSVVHARLLAQGVRSGKFVDEHVATAQGPALEVLELALRRLCKRVRSGRLQACWSVEFVLSCGPFIAVRRGKFNVSLSTPSMTWQLESCSEYLYLCEVYSSPAELAQ